jgi:alkanesulfonate monooxygenase SsuD/methylene tetrahydromethanopterin reductase-like flavin-dependent oxidoreductase (luciferase family)
MAATLQFLSRGRFILGIGAGWQAEEYRSYGYDYPSGGVRVTQPAETNELLRSMWTESPATYHGTYHHVEDAFCEPRPDPPIPIMVGTNGPKALAVTARLADMWNWDGPWEEVYRRPDEILRAECAAIGRPFHEIALTSGIEVSLPDDPASFQPTSTASTGTISSISSARRRLTSSRTSNAWWTWAWATSRSRSTI